MDSIGEWHKHTVDGIHYLQRTVGILVFQSVVDELHIGLGESEIRKIRIQVSRQTIYHPLHA